MLSTGRLLVAACAVLATVVAVPAASATSDAKPHTLLTTKTPIRAFAQDSGRIAWIDGKWRVQTRRVGSKAKTVLVGKANPLGLNDHVSPRLALAGSRVAWTRTGGGNDFETGVWVRQAGSKAVGRIVFNTAADREERTGSYFGALAAGSSTLAFSTVDYDCVDQNDCSKLAEQPSALNGVFRVTGTSRTAQVPNVPGAVALAVSSGRVALLLAPSAISATQTGEVTSPQLAQPGAKIEIRNATTGKLIAQFKPPGTVQALALAGSIAAVVDELPDGTRNIERYDTSSGALLDETANDIAVGNTLAASGNTFVFCVGGRKIETMNASTGTQQVVADSQHPLGLSVSGKRVAWAVNAHGHGRILALTLH